jgi:magnesium-transporting ATPase (P-type)
MRHGGSEPAPEPGPPSPVPVAEGADKEWHAAGVDTVLEAFRASASGLSAADAARRLEQFGPNRLPEARRRSALVRFLLQFHNVFIYVLLGSAALSLLLDHVTDTLVILAVVLVNAVVGHIQEGRAEQALEAIRRMIDPNASVLRDGHRRTIPGHDIVPGDAVLIEAGDRVPADLRLLRAKNLQVEEAALTGESVPVDKAPAPVAGNAALGDRTSMGYSGTFVTSGHGIGIAVGTGAGTELGRISTLIGGVERFETPLTRQIDTFAKQLTVMILGVCVLAFFFGLLVRDYSVGDAFMVVVGLAVSAIPEGLPAVMTIALAIGVQRMASRNAIIRRLPAVETLGAVSVICSDKTGTLTRNEMTVQAVVTPSAEYTVTGVGYEPAGHLRRDGETADLAADPALAELIRAALLCNDAALQERDGTWHIAGDPMEAALLTLAHKAGVDPAAERERSPRIDELPFDAAHRFMATRHRADGEGEGFMVVKGAPERILDMCALEDGPFGARALDREAWRLRAEQLAARGQRVLAFAIERGGTAELDYHDIERDLTLLGLTGFIDPAREEAVAAVADCRSAGIRVLMITGDHAATAREIARQLGLADDPHVLTGQALDGLDDQALKEAVLDTTVFARTSPEHKLRLVNALQDQGLTVAMTGDGVNDAPALKRAAVGVAMGRSGTEAAKEASEMVLADDNFASIVAAVREGRTVYDNLMKVIAWTLPTNGGEGATILLAMLLGLALPITPTQILWINMVTAVALGLTLAFEPTEPGTMQRPPRRAGAAILNADLVWRVVFVSLLFVAGAFGMFSWAEARALPIEVARTMVVNTLVVLEIFYLFSVRYVHGTSLTWTGVVGTPAVLLGGGSIVVAQFLFTYAPFMQAIFHTRPLALTDGLVIVAVGVVLLLIVEVEKRVRGTIGDRSLRRLSVARG